MFRILSILMSLLVCLPGAARAATNDQPEYLLTPPAGWTVLSNPRFAQAWIQDTHDPLSPQLYFSINRDIPEPSPERQAKLLQEMEEIVRQTPEGRVVASGNTRERGMLRMDFELAYAIFQGTAKVPMGKTIRAYFARGDQFLFMALYRNTEKPAALRQLDTATGSFRLTGHAPQAIPGAGLFARSLRVISRWWFLLLPVLLLSGYVIWKERRKKTG